MLVTTLEGFRSGRGENAEVQAYSYSIYEGLDSIEEPQA